MNKRILCLFLVLTLLASAVPALAAEEDGIAISTPEELRQLENAPQGSYYLANDLDMSAIDWFPIAFEGTLDGRGHAIYNLRVTQVGTAHADTWDGNDKDYDTVFAGLFSTLTEAKVSNLTLQGVDIEVKSTRHCFIGALAGYVKNAKISKCQILDARLTLTAACTPEGEEHRTSCNAGIGGIAGFGTASIKNCRAETTLLFLDECDKSLRCEQFMGGVISCGNAAITDTAVVIHGYDECRGYAHNGGLVGMFYSYKRKEKAKTITGCTVSGDITFFEDNTDRRAYCQAFVGELLLWTDTAGNTADFAANEVFDYTTPLRPEKCAEPQYTETVHVSDCEHGGYTEHVCSGCGYTWRDGFSGVTHAPGDWTVTKEATYTESGVKARLCTICGQVVEEAVINPHIAGDWVTAREPDYGADGLEQLICSDCGAVLEERTLPGLIPVSSIVLDTQELTIDYKSTASLSWTLAPADAYMPVVHWKSSDPRVVTVDTDGTVHAEGPGEAVIECVSADGFAKAECRVTVKRTLMQWIREYILFGWVKKH